MKRPYASLALIAALAGSHLWAYRHGKSVAITAHKAQQASSDLAAAVDIAALISKQFARLPAAAATLNAQLEELANVNDPETCRSPAIDAAFDQLQLNRAARQNSNP